MFKDKSLFTSAAASADDASLTTQIVDTFYKIYGTHPGFRVNHAKGVVAEGSFVATPAASALSRAALCATACNTASVEPSERSTVATWVPACWRSVFSPTRRANSLSPV